MSRFVIACRFALVLFFVQTRFASAEESFTLSDELQARCLKVLRDGMTSDEFWPSIHAAEGLTLAGHGEEVRAYLEPKLPAEKDDQQRCGLARELVRAGDRDKAQIMLDILAGDDPHGHVHAAESLYKVDEIGDGKAMRKAAKQTENIKLHLMALAALARTGNKKAMKQLRTRLSDDDPETRKLSAWILGRIGDASDIPQIRKNIETAPDAISRAYNEHSLAALGDAEGLRALVANLQDDDPAIRTYAATFAGDTKQVSIGPKLIPLLDHENIDVRVRAAQSLMVLSRLGEK
ncbi:MAG: HEAT repeat domain-containing protein [Planctomycetaceae bacterium]|nr:HEAT repeat domain-containing protein [Planctomycetales bacterium]MCB9875418.1 HEAT repeat domain-containing protein [Planctomycetaceae bacterium]MCB9939343.1 HEAT repeat domain-containing protein [Planctomycetaceae bacterium]HRX78035.1 HEAT repeat domain-containing protein [Pirellulaceae bacterium]